MPVEFAPQLNTVFADVVQNLAFMFADEVPPSELPEQAADPIMASVAYRGHASGTLRILTIGAIRNVLAANVLGLDESDPEAAIKGDDALKELANVTCGQLLTILHGDKPVFDITPPTLESVDADLWRSFRANPEVASCLVDGTPVMLLLEQPA